jgi:hypothetical protein
MESDDSFIDFEKRDNHFLELDDREERKDQLITLKTEVSHLRAQVKKLKKVLLLSVFESKEDLIDFLNDIW